MIGISNIAWGADHDRVILPRLQALGVTCLEVVPVRTWQVRESADPAELQALRRRMASFGLRIVAFQALLYQRSELGIFGSAEARARTVDHLAMLCDAAAELGAHALVFGAASQRRRGALSVEEADDIAVAFFGAVGEHAARRGVAVCIEPLPAAVGCDYIHTAAEGAQLVRLVGSPGFRLHLDAAALHANGEPIEDAIAQAGEILCHFHVSDLGLAPIGTTGVDHPRIAAALRAAGYAGVTSIEMLPASGTEPIRAVDAALACARAAYEPASRVGSPG